MTTLAAVGGAVSGSYAYALAHPLRRAYVGT